MTRLHDAAKNNETTEILSIIRKSPQSIDKFYWHQYTPLFYAIFNGHFDSVKTLISLGSDVNKFAVCFNPITPLHASVVTPFPDKIVQILIRNGADPSLTDRYKQTPLHYAAFTAGSALHVSTLLESGADLHSLNQNGQSPLDIAQYFGNTAFISAAMPYSFAAKQAYTHSASTVIQHGI